MAAQKSTSKPKKGKEQRSTFWWFFIYPADGVSAEDIGEVLSRLGLVWILSPLHDRDFFRKDGQDEVESWKAGEPKKPHYHCILIFDTLKSFSQVKTIVAPVGGVRVEVVNVLRAVVRYLTHEDDKTGKAKYRLEDITSGGEVDVGKFFEPEKEVMTPEGRSRIIGDMSKFIDGDDDQLPITEFDVFEIFCRDSNWEWYVVLTNSGLCRGHIEAKIKSKRNRLKEAGQKQDRPRDGGQRKIPPAGDGSDFGVEVT